ncbi:MAG TPA: MinD/ParA family protein [Pseudolysinimonas sp.]|nr:MinD/ParA family protein [Pseudolysinimonas sp.]
MADQIPLDEFVLDDIPVAPAAVTTSTMSFEIVPEHAIAAGEAYEQAALEAVTAEAVAAYPPLPVEPRAQSRHARRWVPARSDLRFEPSGELRPSRRPLPEGVWPEIVYGLTMTAVNLGDSRAVRHRKQLDARIARPVHDGARYVPVLARQGGVGATTVTALLGMALAEGRPGRIVALDVHPDRGDLATRVDPAHSALEVTSDPAAADGIVLTDASSNLLDPAVQQALQQADSLVVVSGGTSVQARAASDTVTWLEQNDFAELAGNTVVAIDTATPGTRYESLDAIETHFQARVRDVVRIPYDEELVAGAPARYGALRPDTRDAARDLAALVMDGLTSTRVGRAA